MFINKIYPKSTIVRLLLYKFDKIWETKLLPFFSKVWLIPMRLKGVQIGKNVILFGKPITKMHPLSQIIIEDNVGINNNSFRSSSTSLYGPCRFVTHFPSSKIIIKKDTGLNGTAIIARSKKIILGERVKIAPNVSIFDSPFHYLWPVNKRKKYNTSELDQDVIIGNDVWICTGSLILPGANIGHGSVIAANSIVNKPFPENCLIGGTPAKIIKFLGESKT
tara:strand:+ start:140 stop:802 length:663 start_codon:yes stop_codon:yes gene_type:complete